MSARAKSAPAATRPERSEARGEAGPERSERPKTSHAPGALGQSAPAATRPERSEARGEHGPERSERPRTSRALGAWRIVEYDLIAARRFWRPIVIGGVIMPVLTALSLGVGLGKVVHSGRLGVSYFEFVTPGLLVAAALMSAAGEATYPIMAGFKWLRHFHGMAATPLSARQICDGTLLWIALRLLVNAAVYLAILAAFGGVPRPAAMLAVPVAALTGLAFAAPVLALSASIDREEPYSVLQRLVVMPMFLFSGTFYPLSQLPEWGRWVARIFPLWHGTEVARGAAIGHLSGAATAGHLAYLALWLVAGTLLARRRFAWRLAK